MKRCRICGIEKRLDEFSKNKKHRDGYMHECKACVNVKSKENYYRNTEYKKEYGRAYYRRYYAKFREKAWKKQGIGITYNEFLEMKKKQNNRCKICELKDDSRDLHVDHNHITGEIRGLLCNSCNSLIGSSKESIDILLSVIKYLSK